MNQLLGSIQITYFEYFFLLHHSRKNELNSIISLFILQSFQQKQFIFQCTYHIHLIQNKQKNNYFFFFNQLINQMLVLNDILLIK